MFLTDNYHTVLNITSNENIRAVNFINLIQAQVAHNLNSHGAFNYPSMHSRVKDIDYHHHTLYMLNFEAGHEISCLVRYSVASDADADNREI